MYERREAGPTKQIVTLKQIGEQKIHISGEEFHKRHMVTPGLEFYKKTKAYEIKIRFKQPDQCVLERRLGETNVLHFALHCWF